MGIVFRQSVKTSIVVLGGAILGALILWLSTKFIADQQQFGFTKILTNWAVMLSQFFLFGFNSTLFFYAHKYAASLNKMKVLTTLCLVIPFFGVAGGTIFYYIFHDQVINHFQVSDKPYVDKYFMWLPIYTLIFLYIIILELYLGSQLKVAVASFMREVILRLLNIIVILLYAFSYINFHVLVISTVLIYLVPLLIFFMISLKTKGFGFSLKLSLFTKSEYKEMVHFTWYHFLLSSSVILLNTMDALLIPFYDHKGFVSAGIYNVVVYIIAFLQMPARSFLLASTSVLMNAFNENDHVKARDIYCRASINLLIPTICIAAILFCNLDNAVSVIGNGKNYSALAPLFMILFVGRIVDISTGMNDQILSVTNYYKFNFYVSVVVCAILFLLIRTLVPRYGIYGAAWSTTFTLILFNIAKYLFIWKKLDMQPYSFKSLRVIIAGIPAFVAGHFFPYLFNPARHVYVHTFIDASIRTGIVVVVYILMLIWLKPSPDLEVYLASIKKNRRLF